jgi:hypothetical protein
MKSKITLLVLVATLFGTTTKAQNRTTINASTTEISENLDLRAVSSLFGDSRNLEEFERKLNNPRLQISNLDLNEDNEVDYLRVIESIEGRTHLIIVQAVLDKDIFQDIATIEVEKDNYNQVQIQVVGNSIMYGPNYIYEPVYLNTPSIYVAFWNHKYQAYTSSWNWNYYPRSYFAWNPCSIFKYRKNIEIAINFDNDYRYATKRKCHKAVKLYTNKHCNNYVDNRSVSYSNYSSNSRFDTYSRGNRNNFAPVREGYSRNYNSRNNNRITTNEREADQIITSRNNAERQTRNETIQDRNSENSRGNYTRERNNDDQNSNRSNNKRERNENNGEQRSDNSDFKRNSNNNNDTERMRKI